MSQPRAIVTGATAGIGRHIAVALARSGHCVVVTGRDRGRGEAAVAAMSRDAGAPIELAVADASLVSDGDALLDRVGPLDVLVANAGQVIGARSETRAGSSGRWRCASSRRSG